MESWAEEFKQVTKSLKSGVVAANNHYAGFGPGTTTLFMKMLDIERQGALGYIEDWHWKGQPAYRHTFVGFTYLFLSKIADY